ncbi:response regulator transcription factor [Candidatus Kaiserbacteria bacterium]|nr:MAG: response regulator transcription factor [Candidatus Kaiserbacteria bacterium]
MKILCVGVDETTLEFLRAHGFAIEEGSDIETAEDLDPYLLGLESAAGLVDVEASGLGIFFPRSVRNARNTTPLVGIASVNKDEAWSETCAEFLEIGGDYLVKRPVSPREVIAALSSSIRRSNNGLHDIVFCELQDPKLGDLTLKINTTTSRVYVDDKEILLTGKERSCIRTLALAVDRVLSKEQILNSMYALEIDEPELKIIDVFMCKIRKKLAEVDPRASIFIQTIWGRGYSLVSLLALNNSEQKAV